MKVGFFSKLKTGHSDHPQTLWPAFLVNFSGILQLKNTVLGLIGAHEMRISSFEKWACPVLTRTKMKSSPEALLENFRKNKTTDYKTVEKIVLCVMCYLRAAV